MGLWGESSAHSSAVLAPLVGMGACPTFPGGIGGEGGHDGICFLLNNSKKLPPKMGFIWHIGHRQKALDKTS